MMREIDARFYLLIFRRFTMGVLNIIFAIVLILTSVGVIALVSMQESKRGMSALTGGQSEAVGRNYGRTRDAMLDKVTKVLTAVLFVLTFVISIVDNFGE